jgi:hypothetical protein
VKRPASYDVVMPISKMAAFHGASKRERKALLDFFDRLAGDPFMESEWIIEDATGRTHYCLQVGKHLVTFWADHAVREVKVVKLERIT